MRVRMDIWTGEGSQQLVASYHYENTNFFPHILSELEEGNLVNLIAVKKPTEDFDERRSS